MGGPISHDPLLGFDTMKWCVTEQSNLKQTIDTIYGLGQPDFIDQNQQAARFLDSNYTEATICGMNKFLKDSSPMSTQ